MTATRAGRVWWKLGALLAWVLLSLMSGALVARLFVAREVAIDLSLRDAGARWEIGWTPVDGLPPNGHWIDLAERLGPNQPGPPFDTRTPLDLRYRVSNQALSEVFLAWHDSPGVEISLERAQVSQHLLGVHLGTSGLRVRTLEHVGERPGEAGSGGAYRATAPAGRLVFEPPRVPAWAWLLPAPVCAAALALAFLVVRWLVREFLRRPDGHSDGPAPHPAPARRTSLALRLLTLGVVVGVPVWMHAWAPMIHSGDGTAYVLFVRWLLETGTFDHYDGWRLPGYAILILPFVAWSNDFSIGLGFAQTGIAITSSLLAWGIARRRLSPALSSLAAILVACDPALIVWQRSLLTEQLTIFWIMLGGFLFVHTADRVARRAPLARTIALAALLGLALAGGCLTRPNLQVFAAIAPLCLGLLALRARSPRMLLGAVSCAAAMLVALAPMLSLTHRLYGRWSLTIGSDWNRAIWTWENTLFDWNQSGTLSFEQFDDVRARCRGTTFASWDFLDLCHAWGVPEVPTHGHPLIVRDARCRLLWQETFVRRADRMGTVTAKAVLSQLGVRFRHPPYFAGDPGFLSDAFIGRTPHVIGGTNWKDHIVRFSPPEQAIFNPTVRPLNDLHRSPHARALGAVYDAAEAGRPVVTILLFVGLLRLVRRADWTFVFLGGVFLAHALAVPLMVFTGNLRYTMPWYGLVTVVALVGVFGRPPKHAAPAPDV
ncbi:MAG: hypothetical protein SFY69_07585 [Planctomycetota bacterium]|nr:hypothetical protein [Planctomycetota bacterium]